MYKALIKTMLSGRKVHLEMTLRKNKQGFQFLETLAVIEWELTGSNRRPSACKADALNQLS